MRSRSTVAAVVAIVVSALVGGVYGKSALATADTVPNHYRTFTAALTAIQTQYAEPVESDRMVYGAINGMLQTLDPHSSFMDPRTYAQMRERQEGRYYGLGLTIQSVDGDITAVRVFEGSPAFSNGIRRGDVIATVEGVSAKGWTTEATVNKLKGPKGTFVNIGVRRKGFERLLEMRVMRDQVSIPSLSASFMIDSTTGYVGVTDFAEHTDEDLGDALESADQAGHEAPGLRPARQSRRPARSGDSHHQPLHPKGSMVVYTRGRVPNSDSDYRATEQGDYLTIPMVTLVNRNSASASEIVSGALQDYDRSLVVGETTFGKALVQSVYRVSGGAGLALTTARYYTPSGRLIQRPWDGTFDEYLTYTLKDQAERAKSADQLKYTTGGPQGVFGRRHRTRPALRRAGRRLQPDALRPHAAWPRVLPVVRRAVQRRRRRAHRPLGSVAPHREEGLRGGRCDGRGLQEVRGVEEPQDRRRRVDEGR